MAGGGCGGSTGADVAIPDSGGDTEKTSDPLDSLQAMSIPKDKEIELTLLLEDVFTLIEELSADGSIEKINQRGLYTLTISRDFDKDTAIFSGNGQLSFSSKDLRPKYEAGAVMCIISPTEEAINALLEELGETPNFTLTNASDDPQLYAVARDKDSSGKSHMFTYQIPSRKSFKYTQGEIVILSSDISTDISGDMSGKSEDIPYVPTGTTSADIELIDKRFQIQRLGDFFRWCADGIDSKLAEIEANSAAVNATFRAALDNTQLTSLSSAYNPVKNFSYEKSFVPFGNDNGGRYNRTITRNTTGRYTVYSCHSFSTGSDYYLVQAKLESTPGYGETEKQNDYTDGSPAFWTHYHYGFTDYLINSAYIEGAGAEDANVTVIKTVPSDSVPKSYSSSKSMGWNLGGTVGGGYTQTPGFGANLGLTGGVSHNETVNYTTQNWTIENETSISVPKFRASFMREENDGSPHHDTGSLEYDRWQDIKVDEATTRRIEYTAEWIWEVKKDFWQNRDNVKIIANPIIGERFAHGWGFYQKSYVFYYKRHGSEKNGKATTIESSLPQDLGVPAPAHIYVSKSGFEVASAGANDETFELLCNTDWKIESDSDWCVLRYATPVQDTETITEKNTITGKDTGSNKKTIHFSIEPFNIITGKNIPREANITITELLPGNRTGQTVKISVSQLPPDLHVSVSSTDLTAKTEGGTMSFNLKATGKWTVKSDSNWCVIDPSCTSGDATGSGGKAITFTVSKITATAGFTDSTRKATIMVTDDRGNSRTVYVYQGEIILKISGTAYNEEQSRIDVGPSDRTMSFTLTCNTNWTVDGYGWCTADDSCKSGGSTGSNGKQIICHIGPLGSMAQYLFPTRNIVIRVKATAPGFSVKKDINVVQSTK